MTTMLDPENSATVDDWSAALAEQAVQAGAAHGHIAKGDAVGEPPGAEQTRRAGDAMQVNVVNEAPELQPSGCTLVGGLGTLQRSQG